jgi:hypothetical protein
MARGDVYASCGEDVGGITQFDSNTVDDRLGARWLYFCALRDVEGATKKIELTIIKWCPLLAHSGHKLSPCDLMRCTKMC